VVPTLISVGSSASTLPTMTASASATRAGPVAGIAITPADTLDTHMVMAARVSDRVLIAGLRGGGFSHSSHTHDDSAVLIDWPNLPDHRSKAEEDVRGEPDGAKTGERRHGPDGEAAAQHDRHRADGDADLGDEHREHEAEAASEMLVGVGAALEDENVVEVRG